MPFRWSERIRNPSINHIELNEPNKKYNSQPKCCHEWNSIKFNLYTICYTISFCIVATFFYSFFVFVCIKSSLFLVCCCFVCFFFWWKISKTRQKEKEKLIENKTNFLAMSSSFSSLYTPCFQFHAKISLFTRKSFHRQWVSQCIS